MALDKSPAQSFDRLTVLVPAGAEYKAVKKGLRVAKHSSKIIAIPAGQAIAPFVISLARAGKIEQNVLLMGLGGGLCSGCAVGRSRLLKKVWNAESTEDYLSCDDALTQHLLTRLRETELADGVMCDRVVTAVEEKQALGDRYKAQVVDMESFFLLQVLSAYNVAILRIISDSCEHDLPDISQAIRSDGSLDAVRLATSFVQRPLAAFWFVSSSLKGLRRLEETASSLFEEACDEL